MLDEAVFAHEVEKVFFCGEVVFTRMLLARPRGSSCVWHYVRLLFWGFSGVEIRKIHERETEKPKVLGNSAKSLFSNVDLPVPEGPDTTTGRNFWTIPGYYVCFLVKSYIIASLGAKWGPYLQW